MRMGNLQNQFFYNFTELSYICIIIDEYDTSFEFADNDKNNKM